MGDIWIDKGLLLSKHVEEQQQKSQLNIPYAKLPHHSHSAGQHIADANNAQVLHPDLLSAALVLVLLEQRRATSDSSRLDFRPSGSFLEFLG